MPVQVFQNQSANATPGIHAEHEMNAQTVY
jgi:hypothetical protein